jgi:hypothetical protein
MYDGGDDVNDCVDDDDDYCNSNNKSDECSVMVVVTFESYCTPEV